MAKSGNREKKIILLIFIIFVILSSLNMVMLVKNGFFSSKLQFNHMPITYSFQPGSGSNARGCSDAQIERIDDAVRIIQNETGGTVKFLKVVPGKEDISIFCAVVENGNLTYSSSSVFKISTFIVTEAESQYSHKGNVIRNGAITFYQHKNCGTYPDVEIHEILHIFGFVHNDDQKSMMYPLSLVCDRDTIDTAILEELNDIYS